MKDEMLLGALVIGGLYLMGSLKKDGTTVAEKVGEELAQGAAAGAAGVVKGAAIGTVVGVASVIPGANPATGVGEWKIPISGGFVKGSPLAVIGAAVQHPEILWNILPFLPDY